MRNFSYSNIFLAFLILLASSGSALAGPVNWASLGLDQNQIQNGGQTFTDFAGIPGLTCTITGNEMFRQSYIHVSGQLYLRSVDGTPGSIPAAVITFMFNQPVELSMDLNYFGDGHVAEQALFESFGPYGLTATMPAGTVIGGGQEDLQLLSADSYAGSPASITAPALTGFRLTFDGNDANDIAASTLSMTVGADPVSTQKLDLQAFKALYR